MARNWLWLLAAVLALIAGYVVVSANRPQAPGQPAPHALDQSQ